MKAEKLKEQLEIAIEHAGLDQSRPRPRIAWDVFKALYSKPMESPSGLLFECGTYSFTGPKLFTFSFTRQMPIPGEDEFFQLRMEFAREPSALTDRLKTNLWSFKFGSPQAFFAAVEALPEFRGAVDLDGWSFSIDLDET